MKDISKIFLTQYILKQLHLFQSYITIRRIKTKFKQSSNDDNANFFLEVIFVLI
jgi:hypothetical protein